jgi:DNA-binding response OmpR family regulator
MKDVTVLLAEDCEEVLHLVTVWLKRKGFRVLAGTDGKRALELSRGFRGEIQVLLTDIEMPGLNGIELAKKIKAERTDIKVLLMSGNHSYADSSVGVEHAYLCKPFGCEELVGRLEELLAIKHLCFC